MRTRLKSLILAGCLIFLYGIYYWGIPAIVNFFADADNLQNLFKKHGYNVVLSNPELKMGLRPAVIFKADNITLLNDDNTTALEIQKPYFKAAILPLLLKKADIRDFTADNITARVVYDDMLKIGQYPINLNEKPFLKLQHAKVQLGGCKIDMTDMTNDKTLLLDVHYFEINSFNPDKELKLSTIADFYAGDNFAQISADIDTKLPLNKISQDNVKIDGHVINLNLEEFTPYAKVLSKDKVEKLQGVINTIAKTETTEDNHKNIKIYTEFENLGIYTKDKSASIYSKNKLVIKSGFNIYKNGLNIDQMTINSNKINIEISGDVKNLSAKFPDLDLDVKINDTRCENFIPLLPGEENLVPEIDLLKLKQTVFQGDINGEVIVVGKADYPDIDGEVVISDAYLVKPIPDVQKAIINLKFEGKKLLLDTHVPASPTQYVDVKGPINIYPPRVADLMITSTDSVDLETAQTVLNPLHEILTFDLGPVPVMKLYGNGNISLHVTGTKQDPHAWGNFKFKNTTASFIDIHNLTLTNGSGELTFDDTDTYFVAHSAILNNRPVNIEGTCTLSGELDFKVNSQKQEISNLLYAIKTSPMLSDIQEMIAPIEFARGISNINMNITGKVKDPRDIVFNKNLFAKGVIEMLHDDIKLQELPVIITNTSGMTEFENDKINLSLEANINSSKIKISGNIKGNNADLKIISDKFVLSDGLAALQSVKIPYEEDFAKIYSSFSASYSGSITPVNYNKVSVKGKVYPAKGDVISISGGSFELNNSKFKLSPMNGVIKDSPYTISASVTDTFAKQPKVNGEFKISNFNLNNLNDKSLYELLPPEFVRNYVNFSDFQGVIDFTGKIQNSNIRAFTQLKDISVFYVPSQIKFNISSGDLFLNNNTLNINKVNSQFGEMPIFVDGKINKFFDKTPQLNVYVNAKPTQEFFDQFFNNKAVYPIKVKGDISFTSKITGQVNNLRTKSNLKLDENSSLYYMGAFLGDNQNPVSIDLDSNITPSGFTLNRLQYDKIITSQNNKPFVTPQLTVSGGIKYLPDNNAAFNNLHIKTQSVTDAKIFNIIFRKPMMKQGVFTSDLLLNGTTLNPKIRGQLNITSVDIPFLDSTIKDINLDFKPDKIFIKSRGIVLTNDVNFEAVAENKLTTPYVIDDVKLKLADLDINKLTQTLRDLEAEASRNRTSTNTGTAQNFDLTQVVLKNADIQADTISVRNIRAQDLSANLNLDEQMDLNIDKFKFKIAEGLVEGSFNYNLLTRAVKLKLNLDKANAEMMTEALFDLKGQIYGSMTGSTDLECNGASYEKCMQTLSGDGTFAVSDGKMPKLGSLEYLLKAGNLIRSGLSGLSINSIIDLVTPLKTGEFSSIRGDITIDDGIIYPINIYSNGKDLNLYITGTYNVVSALADMRVFGSLSKNIGSVFGKIKNVSLNTLFNTIPGLNRSETSSQFEQEISRIPNSENSSISRLFYAEIYGDINGENYVKSFRWAISDK